jgi:hypothetical protein
MAFGLISVVEFCLVSDLLDSRSEIEDVFLFVIDDMERKRCSEALLQ